MKFKIDENLPSECATLLRDGGFEADTVPDEGLQGSRDADLFQRCQLEERIFITLDLDFSNIQIYRPGTHHGIIVVRSKSQDKPTILALFGRVIQVLAARSPKSRIVDRRRRQNLLSPAIAGAVVTLLRSAH